jgi:hypothetical protein
MPTTAYLQTTSSRTDTYLLWRQRTLPKRIGQVPHPGTHRACKDHANSCAEEVAKRHCRQPMAIRAQASQRLAQRHTQHPVEWQDSKQRLRKVGRRTKSKTLVLFWLSSICTRQLPASRQERKQVDGSRKGGNLSGTITTTRTYRVAGPIPPNRSCVSTIPCQDGLSIRNPFEQFITAIYPSLCGSQNAILRSREQRQRRPNRRR